MPLFPCNFKAKLPVRPGPYPEPPYLRYPDEETLKGHSGTITHLIELQNSDLCSVSEHAVARIWNPITGVCKHKFAVYDTSIESCSFLLQLQSGELCTVSNKGSVKIWPLHASNQYINTKQSYVNYVNCIVQLRDGRVCLGSKDLFLKILDIQTLHCQTIIPTCNEIIQDIVELNDGKLLTINTFDLVKIWDIKTQSWVATIYGLYRTPFQLQDGRLCYQSDFTGTIKLLDLSSVNDAKEEQQIFCEHKPRVNKMIQLKDGRLCTAGEDGVIKIWDLASKKCLTTLNGPAYPTSLIQLRDGRLAVSGAKGEIRLLLLSLAAAAVDFSHP